MIVVRVEISCCWSHRRQAGVAGAGRTTIVATRSLFREDGMHGKDVPLGLANGTIFGLKVLYFFSIFEDTQNLQCG